MKQNILMLMYSSTPAEVQSLQKRLLSLEKLLMYIKVLIETEGGMTKGKPILYGATVPTDAVQPENGDKFVAMLIGETGQKIMKDAVQPPIVPATGFPDIPSSLSALDDMNS